MSSIDKKFYVTDSEGLENAIADIISSKNYLPDENILPRTSIVKNEGDDVTYLLSKLSDEELIKMLNDQPSKNEYDLGDIANIAAGFKPTEKKYLQLNNNENDLNRNRLNKISEHKYDQGITEDKQSEGFFRLENKPIFLDAKNDVHYLALKKLNELLNSKPKSYQDEYLDDGKRELLFDVLVNQLKTLCCKKFDKPTLPTNFEPRIPTSDNKPIEYMFLILNDELKSNASNGLVLVDPETLQQNSSILLLGPITTPLTDRQLKLIMNRITMELSKPDYVNLLQQVSDGTLGRNTDRIMKNFINSFDTRRYIKPHRCNHQSKLARIYGGPKWLICTGYINLNTPSLYD